MNQRLMTDGLGRSPQIEPLLDVRTSSIHQITEPQSALQARGTRGNHHRIDSCAHWTTHCTIIARTR